MSTLKVIWKYVQERKAIILSFVVLILYFSRVHIVVLNRVRIELAPNELSEAQIVDYLSAITRTYRPKGWSYVTVIGVKDAEQHFLMGGYGYLLQSTEGDERFVRLSGNGSRRGFTPMEVYGLFEIHLFLFEKELSVDIVAVAWEYPYGNYPNYRYQTTTILKGTFEDLLARCDTERLSRRKAARVLGDLWMQETGYVKLS